MPTRTYWASDAEVVKWNKAARAEDLTLNAWVRRGLNRVAELEAATRRQDERLRERNDTGAARAHPS